MPSAGPLDFGTELQLDDPAACEFQSGARDCSACCPMAARPGCLFSSSPKQAGGYRLTVIFRQHGVERRRINRPLTIAVPEFSVEVGPSRRAPPAACRFS